MPHVPDIDWPSLSLVKKLKPDWAGRLNTVFKEVRPLLGGTRPLGAEQFTDHDLAHSCRIAHRIGQFLPKSAKLNDAELYLLLLAVLLHDSGMWSSRQEVLGLPKDAEFIAWAGRFAPEEWKHVQEALASTEKRWMGEMGLQQLGAAYFRAIHPQRLGTFVVETASPLGKTLPQLIGKEYLDPLVTIAVAHSWERRRVLEDDALRPREIDGQAVNLRFLASLLRLGDLLDLGEGRVSTLLWDYLRPLNPTSEAHWRKESLLKLENCTPDRIEVSGTFDIDKGGLATAEAYRLALDWLQWIELEIKDCARILHAHVPEQYRKRCTLGELVFDRARVRAKGLVIGGEVSFELNRKRIIELLGDEIYSSGAVFVRELLQNSLDATRAQMVRDNKELMQRDTATYPADRPWDWPHAITAKPEYEITVTCAEEKFSGKDFVTFTVTDQGTGMTLTQIQRHFLQVGVSYYRTTEFREEFRFPPISRFGIGFLSCLTVASRIEVTTRPRSEVAGLKLSVQLPSEHFLVEKASSAPHGTTVKLWIDPKGEFPPGWDTGPNSKARESASLSTKLSDAVRCWILYPEVVIKINGEAWGPCVPACDEATRRELDHYGTTSVVDVPVMFYSPSGAILGGGRFLKRAYRSGLPMETDIRARLFSGLWHAHRSVHLQNIPPSVEYCRLLFNSTKLPRRSVSAGRVFRGQGNPVADAFSRWGRSWFGEIFRRLQRYDQEAAWLWRLLIYDFAAGGFPADHDLPLCWPVSENGSLHWWSPADFQKNGPFLEVPFGVAWQLRPQAPLPLVGRVHLHFGLNPLEQLRGAQYDAEQLIELPNVCTAIAWPRNASLRGLKKFSKRATFVDEYELKGKPRGKSGDSPAGLVDYPRHILKESEIAAYDLNGNPWAKYSLKIDTGSDLGFEENTQIGRLANQKLEAVPPGIVPTELQKIIVDDGDTWE